MKHLNGFSYKISRGIGGRALESSSVDMSELTDTTVFVSSAVTAEDIVTNPSSLFAPEPMDEPRPESWNTDSAEEIMGAES